MVNPSLSDLRVVYPPDIKAGVAALRHARAAYGSNEEAVARAVYNAMRNDERADLRAVLEAEGAEIAESVGVTFAETMPDGTDGLILAVSSRSWAVKGATYLVWRIEEVDE